MTKILMITFNRKNFSLVKEKVRLNIILNFPSLLFLQNAACKIYVSGPHVWSQMEDNCGGIEQSPVNIGPKDLRIDPNLAELNFSKSYYSKTFTNVLVENNGHGSKRC